MSERARQSCPCAYTTPCHERCTCINPLSSSGCRRCCMYGSVEQRTAMAERLARPHPPLSAEEMEAVAKLLTQTPDPVAMERAGFAAYPWLVTARAAIDRLLAASETQGESK